MSHDNRCLDCDSELDDNKCNFCNLECENNFSSYPLFLQRLLLQHIDIKNDLIKIGDKLDDMEKTISNINSR